MRTTERTLGSDGLGWHRLHRRRNVLSTALARTTTRFELSAPGNMETSIGEYKANVIHSP